jgi:hypothetical protein
MCPVCFTGADTVTRDTLNAGIGVLLGVTVIVLALFARFFVKLARRSRAAAHLVGHEGQPEGRPLRDTPEGGADLQVGLPDDRRVA